MAETNNTGTKPLNKLCSRCGKVKPLSEYYMNREWDEQFGKDAWCKECVNRCITKDLIREYFWENNREWNETIWEMAKKKAEKGKQEDRQQGSGKGSR